MLRVVQTTSGERQKAQLLFRIAQTEFEVGVGSGDIWRISAVGSPRPECVLGPKYASRSGIGKGCGEEL